MGSSKREIRGVRWSLVLMGLLLGAGPAFAQDALPEGFFGNWQGVTLSASEGSENLTFSPDDLDVQIEPDGEGFKMHWTTLTHGGSAGELVREPVEARFAPADHPGVFAFNPEKSSLLLSLFGDPSTNNPLEGEPLLWARVEDETLSVYGLVIGSDGSFDLYQHVRTLTADGMFAVHTHRTELEPAVVIEGDLERDGG
jgi:hypothetical protein